MLAIWPGLSAVINEHRAGHLQRLVTGIVVDCTAATASKIANLPIDKESKPQESKNNMLDSGPP